MAEGAEEDSYSDKFVQSQIDYYKKHGLSGNNSDRLRINGALNQYQRIKNKRIKDGTWSLDQGVAEDMPPPENARKTQIAGTLPTYKKAADILNKTGVKGKALDFGAGLGMGTGELGPDAHSYEPFPGDKFKPHFVDVTKIPDNSYHKIVNLNVLNVVPNTGEHKIRDSIVKNIGRVLAPGGVALITTRGKDVLTIKGTPGEEPTSMISKIGTYQKGFTQKELLQYIQQTLGKGFEVSSIKLGPAGVMIKKLDHEDVAEGKEFGEGDIQRWALKSPENKEIYDEYAKVNQLAKKAWADKDGAAYTGLQNKRYYLRKLIGQKMSEQGVAEDDQQSTSVIPNVVYHGSPSDFNEFDPYATMDGGFYFTSDKKLALSFSKDEDGEIGTLYSAKLTINNPKEIDLHGQQQPSQEQMQKLFHQVKANGHDGVILHNVREFNGLGTQYVVFNPGQIKIISKYNNQNKEQGVAEDTYDNKFDAMMSKVTSKKSLNAREALELMDELIYQGGATYLEALDQASTSFEIDPAKLDKLYQQQAGSLDENESKPVDMKRWLRAYERNEDRNFHTENMLAVAKLVGDENDINAMKRMVRDQNDLGYLTDEQFAIRQVLYKKLWPLVKQKIQTSQTQSLEEEDPCWKGYHQYGMKDKNGKQVPNCVPVKETKSNILKGLM